MGGWSIRVLEGLVLIGQSSYFFHFSTSRYFIKVICCEYLEDKWLLRITCRETFLGMDSFRFYSMIIILKTCADLDDDYFMTISVLTLRQTGNPKGHVLTSFLQTCSSLLFRL